MILKSFFKNKTTKIYLVISTILIAALVLLLSFVGYFNGIIDKIYSDSTEMIIMSKQDSISKLMKNKTISNINKALVFKVNFDYDTIVKNSYTTSDSHGNVIDSYENNVPDGLERISYNDLLRFDFGTNILVKCDNDNKLSIDDVSIGIDSDSYESKRKQEYVVDHPLGFYFNNENIEFNVKDIYIAKRPEITISKQLYDELLEKQNIFVYTARINSYHKSSKVKLSLKKDDINVIYDTFYYSGESNMVYLNSNLVDILNLAIYITIILFLILTTIILKNIIHDLDRNIDLENKLGFNKKQIKFNIFKRLFSLNILSNILGVIISIVIMNLINIIFKLKLILPEFNILIVLFIIILVLDIVLSLFKRIKIL